MRFTRHLTLLAATALSMLTATLASAATVSAVHTFTARDGFPDGALVPLNGLLYGASGEGPVNNSGTLFSVDPTTGAERDLYTFVLGSNGTRDGYTPTSGLAALNGKLYGATLQGNGYQNTNGLESGYGTVFVLDPATGAETPLHAFTGADGAQPSMEHDPLIASAGALYGTAYHNGPNNRGAIYRITASGAFSLVYAFPANASGCNPTGIAIANGTLYGTTAACGQNGGGNVFALDLATGTETILHSFASGSDPVGEPLISNGVLIGVTEFGGTQQAGSVYKINLSSGAYTVLHNFSDTSKDGSLPTAGLTLQNGVLYGVTMEGPGDGFGGTIFTVNANTGAEAVVDSFTLATGYAPFGPLLSFNGALYGTTVDLEDDSSTQQGTVFKFTP